MASEDVSLDPLPKVVSTWSGTGLPTLSVKGGPTMAIRITDDTMTLEIDNRIVATARFSEHAAANGSGAWIATTCSARLFDRGQASTALAVAGLLALGYVSNDPLVMALRAELHRVVGEQVGIRVDRVQLLANERAASLFDRDVPLLVGLGVIPGPTARRGPRS